MIGDETDFDAAIFDLDGLLIDSEPAWRAAEIEVFATAGVKLVDADCRQTMGLRVDEVVEHWLVRRPWDTGRWPPGAIVERILRRVEALIASRGDAMPGAVAAVRGARAAGLGLALASSSPPTVIDAALRRLGVADAFEVVHSALDEERGKPDPAVFLTAARRLGVAPARCLVLEDSPAGVAAAKDAGMVCIAVPDGVDRDDPIVERADRILASLTEIEPSMWSAMSAV